MAEPFFTIVTVTFRNRAGLAATRDSVLAQNDRDFDWQVVDGGSQDGTTELLAAIDDPRLCWSSAPDRGIYDAMRIGLERARGRYVVFMNAGDLFADATVLATVSAAIGSDEPLLVYGDSYETDGTTRHFKPARRPVENRYVMFTHHQSIFYRTDTARTVGFDPAYRMSCDWVMTGRILARSGGTGLYVPRPLSTFERGGVSQGQAMRGTFNRELWRIYRQEHRHSPLRAARMWLTKVAANKLRAVLPGVYDRLRYDRAG